MFWLSSRKLKAFYDCNSARIHTGYGKKCRLIWSHQSEPTRREHLSKWIREYWGHGIYHPWPLAGTHNEHEFLVYLVLLHHNHIFVHCHVPYEQSLASNARLSEFARRQWWLVVAWMWQSTSTSGLVRTTIKWREFSSSDINVPGGYLSIMLRVACVGPWAKQILLENNSKWYRTFQHFLDRFPPPRCVRSTFMILGSLAELALVHWL